MSSRTPRLDFLGIGTPRSGTTSLHAVLQTHPALSLPPGKEILEPAWGAWKRFEELLRAWSRPGTRAGMLVPQFWTEPHLPRAFGKRYPELKLVVLLRNPVERVWSAYRMRWRRGWEDRPFAEFVRTGLNPRALDRARRTSFLQDGGDPAPFVILGSRYGEILSRWDEVFPDDQIHVMVLEDLLQNPERELARLFGFLGVEPLSVTALPRENTAHPGKGRVLARLVYAVHRRWLAGLPRRLPTRAALAYNRMLFWASSNLRVRPDPPSPGLDVLARLRDFFGDDLERLEKRLGRSLPWSVDS